MAHIKHYTLSCLMNVIIVALLLTACTTVPSAPVAPATLSTPIVPAAPTATLAPTATSVPTATSAPTPISLPPLVIDASWATYTNAKYGFSFRYPSNWKLKEITGSVNTMSGHAVHLLHPTDPAMRSIIAFKHADEDRQITPTGMGDGKLISRGSVSLLDQPIERIARVALEKDLAIYYGWPRSAATAGDPTVTGLTSEVEQIADAVVESIALTK